MFGSKPVTNEGNRFNHSTCPSFNAFFRLLPNRRVRIYFLKRDLPPAVVRNYFGNGQFVMPSPFELPADLLKMLGIDYYNILSGAYLVQEDHEYYILDV